MNIRVDLETPIKDGTEVVFRSPVDCSQITGLIVYYNEDGNSAFKEFAFADAHGNNVGDINHLFAENVVVKVILDLKTNMAFVQNADTNAYIERTFVKSVNGQKPDENGNVSVAGGGSGGENGLTPFIGDNGNWWIGETDTGVKAQGDKGDPGEKGEPGPKGEQGIPGEPGAAGEPGQTPEKGVDYFTEEDKAEMVAAVLAALPSAEGVGF